MDKKNNLEFKFDILGIIALTITFISMLFSLKLSPSEIMLAVSVFLVALATYVYFSFKEIINEHAKEIKILNEKINIHKDISDLKAKVEFLYLKMGKKGQTQIVGLLIRFAQIAAIIFATYIILKALGIVK